MPARDRLQFEQHHNLLLAHAAASQSACYQLHVFLHKAKDGDVWVPH